MEWSSGNIYIRPNKMELKGDTIDGHEHHFDHTTIVFTGSVRVQGSYVYHKMRCQNCKHEWESRKPERICPQCKSDLTNRISLRSEMIADREFKAPSHFLVKAQVVHKITALEDNTEYWCVYSHRTPQGEIVQNYTGWPDSYG